MTKLIAVLLLFACATASFTACQSVAPYVQTAQQWLNDPAHQAEINAIANTIITIAGSFAVSEKKGGVTKATAIAAASKEHPNVPAGAIAEIAKNPRAYIK